MGAQTRPGGRVITLWGTPYYNGGLLCLTVAADGTAHGGLVSKTSFMDLRDQRTRRWSPTRGQAPGPACTTTPTSPRSLTEYAN
jgi:hypothetical protein